MQEDEIRYRVLRLLQEKPEMSQRDVARRLGVSLGKANYCVKALVRRGWIKVANFKNSENKVAYMYLLTPRGIEQKGKLTLRFLQQKVREYELLRGEIQRLQAEAEGRE
jgi:EPS-associated MarR family transcriptional regulator